jgi:NhaP-type Na+/H+ or K+/H+ antiporter
VALLVRPAVYFISLARTALSTQERLFIAWFGPRGLSSLLLVLLPVFAGQPGTEYLFAVCALVVLASLIVHGGTPLWLPTAARRVERPPERAQPGDEVRRRPADTNVIPFIERPGAPAPELPRSSASVEHNGDAPAEGDRISIEKLRQLWASGEPVIVLDVRTDRSYAKDNLQAAGAVRLPPDHVADRAGELGLPHDVWLITYCT